MDVRVRLLEEGERQGDGQVLDEDTTVQKLIAAKPTELLRHLKEHGVTKIGTFMVEDVLILDALHGNTMLTMGAETREINWEAAWTQKMGQRKHSSDTSGWVTDIRVESWVVNIRNAANPDKDGLLQPLLKRYQVGGCSHTVFGLPAVQAVVNFKWNQFAYKLMLVQVAVYLTWLLSFTGFALLFQDEDLNASLPELWGTNVGRWTILLEVLALLAMAPFLLVEYSTIIMYRRGWYSLSNLVDVATYALQILISVTHLCRFHLHSGYLSIAAAFQCVLLWFRLQHFARVFRPTKFAFAESLRQVVLDVRWYLFFLILMMWGFACAFCILFRQDQEVQEFKDVGRAMLTMVNYALGGAEVENVLRGTHPMVSLILSLIYQFVMAMVLMNLLIGIMTNSLNKVTEGEDIKLVLHKAEAIDELESTIPHWIEKMVGTKWYPAYVHYLQIDPSWMEAVNSVLDPDEPDQPTMTDLMNKMEALKHQLDAIQQSLDLEVDHSPSRSPPGRPKPS